MDIGVPAEIKDNENRVGMTPAGVAKLRATGHSVYVQQGAGTGSGISDSDYRDAGADIVDTETAWDQDLVVKVKEPQESEYSHLNDQILFTYLHLAAFEDLTNELLETDITAIAYETVEANKRLPLLEPMSRVAGRMAPLIGSYYQTKHNNGRGVLPPGIPGVEPAEVVVVGGGTVGANAAQVAAGIGCDVTIFELDQQRMAHLDDTHPSNVSTAFSTEKAIGEAVADAEIVVGAVLVPGAAAPDVVTEEHVRSMNDGTVIVDVAVDQGGCVATTEATSHSDPVYTEHGVTHYAVTNMPGAYARTATYGLANATLPYIQEIADNGWEQACSKSAALRSGLHIARKQLTEEPVADEFSMDYTDPSSLL